MSEIYPILYGMSKRKAFLLLAVLLEWFGLIAQFILMLWSGTQPVGELLMRFFTFFTITTNLLTGVYLAALLFARPGSTGFFSRPSPQTSFVVYITVVGLVYNLVLRGLWPSHGLQTVVHELLHSVVPTLVIIYWAVWVDTRGLQWKDIALWLIYPLVYTLVVFIRGAISGWYPYPFLDLTREATGDVVKNCLAILVVFALLSVLFCWCGRKKRMRRDFKKEIGR